MHIDLTHGRPLTCSKCGSTNAVNPVNDRHVQIRCVDCGHQVLTPEGKAWERRLNGEPEPVDYYTTGTSDRTDDGHKF